MAGAVLGAVIASAALAAASLLSPAIVLDFDTDLPRAVTSGFYPAERTPGETFAWTGSLATLTLRGIDRDVPWRCSIRMRGARPAGAPQSRATLGVDGLTVRTHSPGGAYEEVEVDAPASRGSALSLSISTAPTFVPSPDDRRELGIQVDRVTCTPAAGAWALPPRSALGAAAIAGAVFGALFAVLSPTLLLSLAGAVLFSSALAFVLTTGAAAYVRPYLEWVAPVALWIATPVLAFAVARASTRRTLQPATGFVLSFSAAVLFIKILTLLHPSKDVVDAVFHAHRLGAVLGGSYYFTQPMPGGVQFPYAIGLYLTAAPWASIVRDHVALLRIVVLVAEAVAAALLYVVISRRWNDRAAGAAAVVLYHVAPLPYTVIGNANLTYAFGQSAAVISVAAAATLNFGRWKLAALAGLFAIASLAFLSHVGIFPLLAVTLLSTGVLYWVRGDRSLRGAAKGILLATVLAAGFAVGSYYAHFPDVYRTLNRVTASGGDQATRSAEPSATSSAKVAPTLTIGARTTRAASLGIRALGPPLIILALVGVWLAWTAPRDRLTLTLAGCGVSFILFLAFRILAPVDARYQRYADEFIERVYYATLPAIVTLAARGAAWGWRRSLGWRLGAAVLVGAAVVIGVQQWSAWIR